MRELYRTTFQDPQNKKKSFEKVLLDANEGKVASVEMKHKIYSKKGYL